MSFARLLSRYVIMVNALMIVVGIVGYLRYGSFKRAAEASRGIERIVIEDMIDLGVMEANSFVDFSIHLSNNNSESFKIRGFEPTCGFQTGEEFPFVLNPGAKRTLNFRMKAPPRSGPYDAQIIFYTSNPQHLKELFRIHTNVIDIQ